MRAHFDGERIQLDEPFELRPNTKLLVTIIPEPDPEQNAWLWVSAEGLRAAYSDDEPEYSLAMIKEPNPKYE